MVKTIECPNCSEQTDKNAENCPHCGEMHLQALLKQEYIDTIEEFNGQMFADSEISQISQLKKQFPYSDYIGNSTLLEANICSYMNFCEESLN